MTGTYVKCIPMVTFNSANLNGGYQAIDTLGIPEACFGISIVNDATTEVTVSLDGINDHRYIPAYGQWELSSQTNSEPKAHVALFQKGQIFYVSGTAGAGTISLSAYYI